MAKKTKKHVVGQRFSWYSPKRVTAPIWGPPPSCKQTLSLAKQRQRNVQKSFLHVQVVVCLFLFVCLLIRPTVAVVTVLVVLTIS